MVTALENMLGKLNEDQIFKYLVRLPSPFLKKHVFSISWLLHTLLLRATKIEREDIRCMERIDCPQFLHCHSFFSCGCEKILRTKAWWRRVWRKDLFWLTVQEDNSSEQGGQGIRGLRQLVTSYCQEVETSKYMLCICSLSPHLWSRTLVREQCTHSVQVFLSWLTSSRWSSTGMARCTSWVILESILSRSALIFLCGW